MIVNKKLYLAANPFIDAYLQSDSLGKAIFIGLIILSVVSWILLVHKVYITHLVKKNSAQFQQTFKNFRTTPLHFDLNHQKIHFNPFLDLYEVLKKYTTEVLNKNLKFGQHQDRTEPSYLSPSDLHLIQSNLVSHIVHQTKKLEKNLFILSTIVSLAPFLGLLGTVWGILMTFSEMQSKTSGNTHQMVLGGLSLALATTVLGLIDAIPALIGYNYLKNSIRDFEIDMESFSTDLLSAVEIQYRKVDAYD